MDSAVRLLTLLVLGIHFGEGAPTEDLISSLPEFGATPSSHYSGYLNATAGCHPNNGACFLHYYFCETSIENAPVVLWLNGGPGASSMIGLLEEMGPLLMDAHGGLMENPYAWTNVANVLVLESPVGVGFSYCERQMETGVACINTDKYTATASHVALLDFYAKFPELRTNDMFLTGESYAGVYIPTLAYEILLDGFLPLRGLAVGDPCTDMTAQHESMDSLWYGTKYGLVDEAAHDTLVQACGGYQYPNAMLKDDDKASPSLEKAALSPECILAQRKYLLSSSNGIANHWPEHFVDRYSLFAPVTDVVDDAVTAYLNRKDVQEALHIKHHQEWSKKAKPFDYTKQYDACNRWAKDDDDLSMIDFYRKIAPQLETTFVYNGDTDPCVSYEGTRTAMKRVGFRELDGGGYRPWFYNHTGASEAVIRNKAVMFGPDLMLLATGAQFGGHVVNYEHSLSFLTVHGSGHMVPQFRPLAALHILSKLVGFSDLSPLLPTNETLLALNSSKEFAIAMDRWTERAKKAPYVVDA